MEAPTIAQLHFTSWLRELVPDGPLQASGATVGDALAELFNERPHVRSYVLDDRDGLPQRDAFDLVYRHGLDVDATGTQLAMGSTTGSLWTSDNAGAAWQLVNAHLPPVYAVRLY